MGTHKTTEHWTYFDLDGEWIEEVNVENMNEAIRYGINISSNTTTEMYMVLEGTTDKIDIPWGSEADDYINNKNEVIVKVDNGCDMVSVTINGKSVFFGNTWDFDMPSNLISILKNMRGVDVVVDKEWSYE